MSDAAAAPVPAPAAAGAPSDPDPAPGGARRHGGSAAIGLWLRLHRGAGAPAEALRHPPRPDGRIVWFHAAGAAHLPALAELIRRLGRERPHVHALVTGGEEAAALAPLAHVAPDPGGSEAALRGFLDHWRPRALVLAGGVSSPRLVQEAALRALPVLLIDATATGTPGWRWWPGLGRALMQRIDRFLVQDAPAARQLRRLGAPASRIEIAGRMEEGHGALPHAEAEREALARSFRARPAWLALSLPEAEENAILAAHREAMSQRHRLLLVIVPDDPARGAAMAARMAAEGWDTALRSREEEPDEEDQIYIADTEGELGLWYRLAPVTYMGGTLSGRGAPRHPFEAAALGSAILHGPKTGAFAAAYKRLGSAEAARLMRGAPQMGMALSELLLPDRAAQMAHNAWDVTSSGAEVTDRVLDTILSALDAAPAVAERA